MQIKIDLNINLPDTFIQALANLTLPRTEGAVAPPSHPAPAAASAKPKAEKAAAQVAEAKALAAEGAKQFEADRALAAQIHVTDEMLVAAADKAIVKFGGNPAGVKNAIAAYFQKADGSPGTLMTTRPEQRNDLLRFVEALAETGDATAAATAIGR